MTTQMIDRMYARRNRLTLVNMLSPRQSLTFNQLRYYYEANGLTLGNQFERTLDLVDEDGKYNYAAYMLADDNGVSIKVAKYAGTDKVDLVENEEYGYCCLLKAADRVLEKMVVENKTFAKVTPMKRLERKMIDPTALAEAVINGIIHNDFSQEFPPVVEIYSDRLTITSHGGLIDDLSQEDFFNCISKPRNRVLMRVFKDTGKVEQLGSGMDRILKAYDRSIFNITPSLLVVTFPFAEGYTTPVEQDAMQVTGQDDNQDSITPVSANVLVNVPTNVPVNETARLLLDLIAEDSTATYDTLAEKMGLNRKTIQRNIQVLKDADLLRRVGSNKTGYWEVTGG